ncbi:5-oxoprolinase subunit PxpB [Rhodococcus sp. NPDC057529]|uniref:5-oxoprolinase subunit PxpB n=1 Tax=Rhodococcus sp. NPDC057529 TaxID=3346158 RepID=UPI00366B2D2B
MTDAVTLLTPQVEVEHYGDSAVLVLAVGGASEQRWQLVNAIADNLQARAVPGIYGLIPAFDSVLVEFDSLLISHQAIRALVEGLTTATTYAPIPAATFTVPVVYGGDHGPDLAEVAQHLELTPDEVVELHVSSTYTVRMLGGPAGAPMMDGPPFPARIPRRSTPRIQCPAGSIAVAGNQGTIYPFFSPGGWQLIARTPLKVVDLDANPISAYRPGDRIRFEPIPAERWADYAGRKLERHDG